MPLLQKAGVDPEADEGLIEIEDPKAIAKFIESCRKLRLWSREMAVKL
jgi:catalase